MTNAILTLNAGSSSLKFAIFDGIEELTASVRGEIGNLDVAPHLIARDAAGTIATEQNWPTASIQPFAFALNVLLEFAEKHLGHDGLTAVGHRVVHRGADHVAPELITPVLLAQLEQLTPPSTRFTCRAAFC